MSADDPREPSPLDRAAQRGLERHAIQAAEDAARAGYANSVRVEQALEESVLLITALIAASDLAVLLPDVEWDIVEAVERTARSREHVDFRKWDVHRQAEHGLPLSLAQGAVVAPRGTDSAVAVAVVERDSLVEHGPAPGRVAPLSETAAAASSPVIHVVRYTDIGFIAFDMGWRSLGWVKTAAELELTLAQASHHLTVTRAEAADAALRDAVGRALDAEIRQQEKFNDD